jgi:non-ribosomal peptide synthetase component F
VTGHLGDCLPDLLRAQARQDPAGMAVLDGRGGLTFAELVSAASRTAARLRRSGTGPDDRVGVLLEPSAELVIAVWGVLFAGCAYLPLAPDYPDERLRYIVQDAGTTLVLAGQDLAGRAEGLVPAGTPVLTPDPTSVLASAESAGGPELLPQHLAYVIYTSGSTGRPKGAMIEHRSIVSQLRWLRDDAGVGRGRRVLQKTPLSFDAAQWEVLASACGATVVMGEPGTHRDPGRLIDTVLAHDVTTVQCVPTLLHALLDTGRLGECVSLRQIFCGGEALGTSLALRTGQALPECSVTNLYGPTECTINATSYLLPV